MAVLVWNHGKSKAEAIAAVQAAVAESGHADAVKWDGAKVVARSGPFGSVLNLRGEVTDDAVILEKCGGLAGGKVLTRSRELFARLFPGGEQPAE